LALKLATRLVAPQEGEVTALRCVQLSDKEHSAEEVAIEDSEMTDVAVEELSDEQSELHDELMLAHEEIEAGLGRVPDNVNVKVLADREVAEGARQELMENDYDLVVIGAALAHSMQSGLFGSLTSEVAKSVPTSVLLVRQYEPEPVTWTRRQLKQIVESAEESQS
jgi:nucleotide-binding universal stress UspA family protein